MLVTSRNLSIPDFWAIQIKTAKNLPIESMMPKAGGAGAAGSTAGNRRAAAGQAGNAGPGNKVNLNDGAGSKARGGCC